MNCLKVIWGAAAQALCEDHWDGSAEQFQAALSAASNALEGLT